MFSKLTELSGATLIAIGIAYYLGVGAALLFGGIALVFIGTIVDDDAVGLSLKRGTGWVRYAWHRQVLRENGIEVPNLRVQPSLTRCECEGDPECPICDGRGFIPDPEYQVNRKSPHPPIKVNPQAEKFWSRAARARQERAKVRDRTPALSRYEANGDDFERLA